MATIGFLGLGTMGSAMARRLVDAGHDVRVWNRSPDAAAPLLEAGAVLAASPGDALEAGLSVSMLADDAAAETVLDAAAVRRARGIHVNMASISPAAADRLRALFRAAGAEYVAAPVLGRPTVAAEGKLNILVAGRPAAVEDVLPVLEVLGARVWRLGEEPRVANVAKVVVNYNIIHAIQAIGESLATVERHGIDGRGFVELLTSTLFGGVAYSVYGAEIVDRSYIPPGFLMALGYKDLRLAEEVAGEASVHLPTLDALKAVFERALADEELARSDWGAAAEVSRRGLLGGAGPLAPDSVSPPQPEEEQ
ncbi:NAD(P)-dependent oxidoreductase [Microbacterium sp. BK668]|uniref:NAD(P)-dependent oxidoreductase n=1 Tax=Microbacterium sp. BK668 TaxID=2512118 RepID=UPI00106019BD|nr:NAD(P)-dependent oxidoreductase [Microbacterium sp. BK668]TDN92167.1 3-hydroxyisobutyrate dehydrogenase-like beta-hydroxyacid dehydrogenase [Microbacterium sp. BK668]